MGLQETVPHYYPKCPELLQESPRKLSLCSTECLYSELPPRQSRREEFSSLRRHRPRPSRQLRGLCSQHITFPLRPLPRPVHHLLAGAHAQTTRGAQYHTFLLAVRLSSPLCCICDLTSSP